MACPRFCPWCPASDAGLLHVSSRSRGEWRACVSAPSTVRKLKHAQVPLKVDEAPTAPAGRTSGWPRRCYAPGLDDTLTAAARENGADLIVMASHAGVSVFVVR